MKVRKCYRAPWLLLAGALLLTGCGDSKKNVFEQAGKDLEQEYYEYALEGYEEVIADGSHLPQAYRGAGIANLRMSRYEEAIEDFTNALGCDDVSKALRKDILSYRATAYLKDGQYENALADCQRLAEEYSMDANSYFLTGMVALEMDSYDEASSNFEQAYAENSTYEMAIRIYQVYRDKEMEADGTKYLETALTKEAKTAEDYCDRGKVYYYMEDYEKAKKELTNAANQDNTEALLLLGMVYLGQNDVSNARSMYQEYIEQTGSSAKGYNGLAQCDIADGKYSDALDNIAKGLEIATTEEMQDLLSNEIVVYERQLDFQTAMEKAKEFLALFPDDESISREMVFLKSRIKEAEDAQATSEEETDDGSENLDGTDDSDESDYQ